MIGRRARNGFTLLEVLIALAIVGALVGIAFAGLRVAMAAWTKGEDRAEVHQHLRGLALVLARTVGAAHPYRGVVSTTNELVLLFRGTADRLDLVTQAPPLPAATPVAFTAVVIQIERDEGASLVIRQRALPNRDPFTDGEIVLRDPGIERLELSYLNSSGSWQDSWDSDTENSLPRAIRLTVAARLGGRTETFPLTVALRANTP
jgi:general secretion pathway protein J